MNWTLRTAAFSPSIARKRIKPTFDALEDRRLLTIDSTFGTAGSKVFPFSSGDDSSVSAVALQQDGKIVEVGTIQPGSTLFHNVASVFAVARLTTTGALDPTFGTNGITTISIGNSIDSASALAIDSDGDIVVVGTASQGTVTNPTASEIAVARLLPTGKPDTSFGGGTGQVSISFPSATETGSSVAIQPDNKVVVVGTVDTTGPNGVVEFGAARLNTDGSLDSTFGTNGLVTVLVPVDAFPMAFERDSGSAVATAIQSDGKILIGGDAGATDYADDGLVYSGSTSGFAVARLNTDGSLDSSFGTDGGVVTQLQPTFDGEVSDYGLTGFALQADGKIVLAGTGHHSLGLGGYTPFGVDTRLNADGSADSTFTDGEIGGIVALTSAGRIDVANGNGITQLNTDGTFSDNGATAPLEISALAIQPDGKIIAAGTVTPTSSASDPNPLSQAAVARLNGQDATADYFGTGQSDLAVYDPSTATFDIETASGKQSESVAFGPPSTLFQPVVGDFDNDGKTDLALYDSQDGLFAYRPSTGRADVVEPVGMSGGIPVFADDSILVYYPQYAVFANIPDGSSATTSVQLGVPGLSLPVAGNFTGQGSTNLGYYVPKYSVFGYQTLAGATTAIQFGPTNSGFLPAIGDYDGDGKSDLALYSSQFSLFLYQPSSGGPPVAVQFGPPDDGFVAVPGDYDGDGKTDLAIYNAQYGIFIDRPSGGGADKVTQFGPSGGQATAVLTAGVGSDLITPAIRIESFSSGTLSPSIAIAPMADANDAIASISTTRSTTTRQAPTPPTPLP